MNTYTNAYAARLESSSESSSEASKKDDGKAGNKVVRPAHGTAQRFASVELLTETATVSVASNEVSISLQLPNGVETRVAGLDSDSATLLLLELVKATSKEV